jgi:hypothetical protein
MSGTGQNLALTSDSAPAPAPAHGAPAPAPALASVDTTSSVPSDANIFASSTTSSSSKQDGPKTDQFNFLNNNTVKAVLYIILILYASVIAPKLPNWIIPYLEDPLVKIFIVFIIGWLATNDVIAAIIATVGVAVTYIFISEIKVTNCVNNICDNEEEETKEPKRHESKEPKRHESKESKEDNTYNLEHFNSLNYNSYINHDEEHFDNNIKEHFINHDEEHFDNHIKEHFINHDEEHFDNHDNNNVEEHFINHDEEHF